MFRKIGGIGNIIQGKKQTGSAGGIRKQRLLHHPVFFREKGKWGTKPPIKTSPFPGGRGMGKNR